MRYELRMMSPEFPGISGISGISVYPVTGIPLGFASLMRHLLTDSEKHHQ